MQSTVERIVIDCAFGVLIIEGDEHHLFSVRFGAGTGQKEMASAEISSPVIAETVKQIGEYAAGNRKRFELPYELSGTDFQKRVWQALTAIDFGEQRTYGEIAADLGNGGSSRAVGQAAGRNPLLIIIPCHRLVGSGGKLGGFAAGIEVKSRLLEHEETFAQQAA